jgi:N4-gp56 family major capsid protein
MDTSLIDDLEAVSGFVNTSNYPGNQSKSIMEAEWGSTKNVRWLISSVGSVSSAATPVYNNFIIGQEAYGVVNLGSEMGEFYVKPLGSAGSADPLNQRATVGWMLPFVSRILNDNFMINLMASHS